MKNFRQVGFVFLVLILAGCLPAVSSVHPLYLGETPIDEAIIGTWGSSDEDNSVIVIERKDSMSYLFSEFDTEKNTKREGYDTRLVKIGEASFLNFQNSHPQDAGDLMLAVHTFVKFELVNGTLTLNPIDAVKFQALMDIDERFKLDFIHPDKEELLVTSLTSRLQEVMALAVTEQKNIFGESIVLERKKKGAVPNL